MDYGQPLPFTVHHGEGPFRGVDGSTTLTVEFGAGQGDAAGPVMEAIALFAELASSGALCGDEITPRRSGMAPVPLPGGDAWRLAVSLRGAPLDDAALVVLCDLLYGSAARDGIVSLRVDSGRAMQTLRCVPGARHGYPGVARQLPFTFTDEEPEGGGLMFRIELANAADTRALNLLQATADLWTRAVLHGAYTLPMLPPARNHVEPEPVIAFANTAEWPMTKLLADPACIAGFVNAVAALHDTLPVRSVLVTQ